jgi:pimeloyl-ACP methyl ester carboxylesterase
MSLGMTLSVLCSEDVPMARDEEIEALTRGTFVGRAEVDAWRRLCAEWPRADLPERFDAPVSAPSAALILSGVLDPVTPPVWGEEVAASLPRARHVVVPHAAHNTSFTGCVPDLIAAFIREGTAAGLDASCVDAIRTPPFVIGPAGPAP